MTDYRVFDQETASLLFSRTGSNSIEMLHTGEYFSADAGEVILAPSVKSGEVLYIRIRSSVSGPQPSTGTELAGAPKAPQVHETPAIAEAPPIPTPVLPAIENKSRRYVATGILGLDGEMEEETPEPPKPWWKKLFVD